MRIKRVLKWIFICLFLIALVPAGWVLYRVWPRKLPGGVLTGTPKVFVKHGTLGVAMSTELSVAEVGNYPRVLQAFLHFDFLRSRNEVDPNHVFLCDGPGAPAPGHRIFLRVENNVLQSVPFMESLVADGSMPEFTVYNWSSANLSACRKQSARIAHAFRSSPQLHLYQIPDKLLIGPMADFLVFKSATDIRVRTQRNKNLAALTVPQARQLAQDILVISRFYSLPLGYFLAIGAMENNYMSVRGDLGLAVWKRRPQPGDVVLKRRRGRVLVRNYSVGVWQITLDTLRYEERLYRRDLRQRDYSVLPERLQPQITRDPRKIPPETLTTYAGLLFRHLLNHFHGNIMKAVGAYNGGADNPNLAYAHSVHRIEQYARRVIVHAVFFRQGKPAKPQPLSSSAVAGP